MTEQWSERGNCRGVHPSTMFPEREDEAGWQRARQSSAIPEWHARAVIDRLGGLIDALNDDLQHEVSHSAAVREAVVTAVEALDDDRYTSYLNDWWLGGDHG